MGILNKKIGPVFYNEKSGHTSDYITKMLELEKRTCDKKLKAEIQEQIRLAECGRKGEEEVIYQLKNSGMDMYFLHDIYLEYGNDLHSQIDFIVITRQSNFILECKNLTGNIEIDEHGDFIQQNDYKEESISSPTNQNRIHLDMIKMIRGDEKNNIISKTFFERNFDLNYKSLVVLTNPKTIINTDRAPEDLKSQIVRADQLVRKIKQINDESKLPEYSNKQMQDLADFFMKKNNPERFDYSKKYSKLINNSNFMNVSAGIVDKTCPRCGNKLQIKTAKRGKTPGKQFYGCTAFPKCTYSENIPDNNIIEALHAENVLNPVHVETKEEREKRWEKDWE